MQISQQINIEKLQKILLLDCIGILFLPNFSFLILYIAMIKQILYLFCNCKKPIFLVLFNRNIFPSTVFMSESISNKQSRRSSQIKKMRETLCLETLKRWKFCENRPELKLHQKHIWGGLNPTTVGQGIGKRKARRLVG